MNSPLVQRGLSKASPALLTGELPNETNFADCRNPSVTACGGDTSLCTREALDAPTEGFALFRG